MLISAVISILDDFDSLLPARTVNVKMFDSWVVRFCFHGSELGLRKRHLFNFLILAFAIYLHYNSKSSSDDAMGTKSYVTNIKHDLFINLIRK